MEQKNMVRILGVVAAIIGVLIAGAYLDFDPFDSVCKALPFCEADEDTTETELISSTVIWQEMQSRLVLDIGKYTTHNEWEARREPRALNITETVTHTMKMEATVNITIGINLQDVEEANITVDNDAQQVSIRLPEPQPVECFIEDVQYKERKCLFEQCNKLEDDLKTIAVTDALNSDDLQIRIDQIRPDAEENIEAFLAPLVPDDYTLLFIFSGNVSSSRIPGNTCDQYR